MMDQPRERLHRLGTAALSNHELLALVLGTGTVGEHVGLLAGRILTDAGGVWALARMGVAQLARINGLGPAKASRIAAAFELGSRAMVSPQQNTTPLCNAESVYLRYGRQLEGCPTERFFVVSVDAKNRPQMEHEVARGGRVSCQVDPAEVFRVLLCGAASGAIFVHNHPSGDPEPSHQDLELTRRLLEAATLLDIRILDHVIVGNGTYASLRDVGFWPAI